jgi:transposase InsO family protein
MTEDEKMQVAVFRFSVISDFVNANQMSRSEKRRLMRDKCARKWQIPFSEKTRIGKGTVQRWIRVYKAGNGQLRSLYPQDRSDKGKSRAIDEETCLAMTQLRQELAEATVAQLIEAMAQRNLVSPGTQLYPTTVYRFLHQFNLMNLTAPKGVDRRKFEAELPNDLWQSDVLHGPRVEVDGKMRKTYLIAVIDDHSRLVVYGRFYLSETLVNYLDAFENALAKRGLPRKLYVDNGAAFRSKHLEYITASLGITLVHSKPYQPQGRGKIERFFLTVRSQMLAGFKGQTLDELNAAFRLWLNDVYHQRKHGATGQTPLARFTSQMHCLRTAPKNLKDYFRKVVLRRVAKDRTITLNGRLFEGPIPLIGKRVQLLYHESEPESVEVKYQNQTFGMARPVNLNVNCRVKRDKNNHPQIHVENHPASYRGGKLWSSKRRNKNE